jgi:hypothetical protein
VRDSLVNAALQTNGSGSGSFSSASASSGSPQCGGGAAGAGGAFSGCGGGATPRERGECGDVRIAERPVGRDGRVVPEVIGVQQVAVEDAQALIEFFMDCCDNRSVASTRMNDRSSRSHAIYTVVLHRTVVDVAEDGGKVGRRGAATAGGVGGRRQTCNMVGRAAGWMAAFQ